MEQVNVFVSVGGTATDQQEAFVSAVEARLRSEGMVPHTVGRNTFGVDAPLKKVTELMDECSGTVVIALERFCFESGVEKRGGPKQTLLSETRLPTPWNQVEAAMAYSRGHPLLIIVESGLKSEGLLEKGYDWYVQWVEPNETALVTPEFNGVLADWKKRVMQTTPQKLSDTRKKPADMTIGELIGNLQPAHLWAILVAIAGLVAGAFTVGKMFGH